MKVTSREIDRYSIKLSNLKKEQIDTLLMNEETHEYYAEKQLQHMLNKQRRVLGRLELEELQFLEKPDEARDKRFDRLIEALDAI